MLKTQPRVVGMRTKYPSETHSSSKTIRWVSISTLHGKKYVAEHGITIRISFDYKFSF